MGDTVSSNCFSILFNFASTTVDTTEDLIAPKVLEKNPMISAFDNTLINLKDEPVLVLSSGTPVRPFYVLVIV
jgi:hypothetical protein